MKKTFNWNLTKFAKRWCLSEEKKVVTALNKILKIEQKGKDYNFKR